MGGGSGSSRAKITCKDGVSVPAVMPTSHEWVRNSAKVEAGYRLFYVLATSGGFRKFPGTRLQYIEAARI